MAMLVGFHTEGWDHLVLRAYVAKLLDLPEGEIEPDWIESLGRGWEFVLRMLPKALQRFYGRCAQFAVVGLDSDGNVDVDRKGIPEDPDRPRHWLHSDSMNIACRQCQIEAVVQQTRTRLDYLPCKPGRAWPVLVAVPVEAIEAWLLASRALVAGHPGELRAENRPHGILKQRFYGRPAATRNDVEDVALPLVRSMTPEHLQSLRGHSHSFRHFSDEVQRYRDTILGHRDCWAERDRAAHR